MEDNTRYSLTVKGIVYCWLTEKNYEGLCNCDYECGCDVEDLMPCGDCDITLCIPAFRVACDCEDHDGFHYQPREIGINNA